MGANASPLVLAVNRRFSRKMTGNDDGRTWWEFNTTFENETLTVAQFHEAIAAGHSFCPRHRHVHHKETRSDGTIKQTAYRHSKNWMPTSVFGIDIDHGGMTLEQLERDPFFHANGCFGYTTTSHRPDRPRIRAGFALEATVQRIENYSLLKRAVAMRYGADPSDRNPMHAYAGNATDSFYYVDLPDNRMTLEVARAEIATLQEYLAEEAALRQTQAQARINHDDNGDFPNADDVAEMLSYLDVRGEYIWWLKVLMSVCSRFPDETGVALVEAWSPGKPGEVEMRFKSFGSRSWSPSIGWLVRAAEAHGYVHRLKRERERNRLFNSFIRAARGS